MADNIAAKSDASATVGTLASDEIGGIHYIKNKLVFGADDTATDVTGSVGFPVAVVGSVTVASHDVTNAGTFAVQVDGTSLTRLTDIETNTDYGAVVGGGAEATALRVTIASDSTGVLSIDDNGGSITVDGTVGISGTVTVGSHAVTNAGTFVVQVDGDALTALQLIDDAVYTNSTGTPSKGLAVMGSDGTNPQLLSTTTGGHLHIHDGGNSITVDGTVAISGSVTVGSHAVTNAGTFAVQVDGTALTRLTDIETNTDFGAVVGGGAEATALRVTIANDSTGVVSIDDGGGSLTVDGTVGISGTVTVGSHAVTNVGTFAVQVDGTALTRLTDIETNTDSLAVVGGGTEATALRVTIANDSTGVVSIDDNGGSITVDGTVAVSGTVTVGSHAVTNAGTFAVQVDGDALTALQLIDDAIYTDDGAWTGDSSKHMLAGGIYQSTPQTVTDGKTAPLQVNSNGSLIVEPTNGYVVGTAGTASTQVVTVQGIASGVAIPISDNGGSLTVDGTVAVSGTVTVGSHAVTNAGTFATQIDGTALTRLTDIETNTNFGAVVGGGTEATALRVTIANDSTGVVSIDDNGGSITVDGTVTANLSATDNAVLDTIDAVLDTINAKLVTGTVIGDVNLGATDNAVLDSIETNTSKGASHHRNIDANAETEIKGSAGTLHWIHSINLTNAIAYLHLYDQVAASVTPGTTTPSYTFPIPTPGTASQGGGFVLPLEQGFSTGITYVVTTTTDGSTGDPGTNGVMVNAGYT